MALTLKKRFLKRFFGYHSIIFLTIFLKTLDRIYRSSYTFKSEV